MNKQDRIKIIKRVLNKYYPHPKIPLKHKNKYTLLIAIILSGNSTDRTVNTVMPIIFKKAPTPQKMLTLKQSELQNIIRPCGLYKNKSKSILAMSKILVEKYKGRVPNTFEELEALPGVGHKTASVVMGSYHKAAFAVDTHIHRCAKRWGLSSGKNRKQTEEDLKEIFAKKNWHKAHLQIIYFGRNYCKARGHDKKKCPICSLLD